MIIIITMAAIAIPWLIWGLKQASDNAERQQRMQEPGIRRTR